MTSDGSVLKQALLYPWNDGDSGTTLVGGGILTLLSPLVVPALLVLGYNLRVVEAVIDGEDELPVFEGWGGLFVDGIKAAIVLLVYVVVPIAIGTAILAFVAGAAGFRFGGGPPTISGGLAVGGLAFVIALLLGGLALLVWYLAPAALVHLGRTRRLGAAFVFGDVRGLARSDAYGSGWLQAVGLFAANAVVLMVLNAAGIGVILSGFVTFYAVIAMSFLYAQGADATGFEVDRRETFESQTADASEETEGADVGDEGTENDEVDEE